MIRFAGLIKPGAPTPVGRHVPMVKAVQRGEESDGGTAGVRSLIDEIVLDPPAHDEPHRIYFRDSAFEEQGHQGAGLAGGRARDGAFKLIEAAEARWRAVNAPHLVALVRAGAVFEKAKLIERPVDSSTTKEVA